MKHNAARSTRSSGPVLVHNARPANLSPTAVDVPANPITFVVEADQCIELDGYQDGEKTCKRWMHWKVKLVANESNDEGLITDIQLRATYTDTESILLPPKTIDLGDMVGGFFSVAEFRRVVAALNKIAATLPESAVFPQRS